MKEALADITRKLREGAYRNEEHVRLCVVARLLHVLGWDIWNPNRVWAEFRPIPAEDGTKVDLALFAADRVASVYIEVKGVGKIQDLNEAERQLRDYNRNNTAVFTILTDGRTWRFYFSQTSGEFRDKCFRVLDLGTDGLEDVELAMTSFLSLEAVSSGQAENEAKGLLKLTRIQRLMEELLPEARRRIAKPPFPALPEALVTLMDQHGSPVPRQSAIEFLESRKENPPTVKGPPTVPIEDEDDEDEDTVEHGDVATLNPDRPGSLRFTSVSQARFGQKPARNWNDLVSCGLKAAKEGGIGLSEVRRVTQCQVEEGNRTDAGFHPVFDTGWCVAGMDANRAWECALKLAKRVRCHLEARFWWRDKDGAARPGRQGVIRWVP